MKKITQKLAFLVLSLALCLSATSVNIGFAAEQTKEVTLRIEGVDKNLFYETVEVPYTDTLTLQEALTYIDAQDDSIAITGVDTAYITDINGEAAGQFGGWDGWLYKVNGADASVGIDSLELADGDKVVLYYGDPFGVGMQFPVADVSAIKDGVISFTSSDTTFDAEYNPVVTVNPVVGATVTWTNGDTTKEYVTDDNGAITVDADQLTEGAHTVQISKVGDTKLPLVLRFAPDNAIIVDAATTVAQDDSTAVTADNTAIATVSVTDVPKTGEKIATIVIFLVLAIAALAGLIIFQKKVSDEKKNNSSK